MPNPTPKIANLTNAGKGRPKLNKKTYSIALPAELVEEFDRIISVSRSEAIESLIRQTLEGTRQLVPKNK